jgi:hypothetical protein
MEKDPHKDIGRKLACVSSADDLGKAVMTTRNLEPACGNVAANRVIDSKSRQLFVCHPAYVSSLFSVDAVSPASDCAGDIAGSDFSYNRSELRNRRRMRIARAAKRSSFFITSNNTIQHALRKQTCFFLA